MARIPVVAREGDGVVLAMDGTAADEVKTKECRERLRGAVGPSASASGH